MLIWLEATLLRHYRVGSHRQRVVEWDLSMLRWQMTLPKAQADWEVLGELDSFGRGSCHSTSKEKSEM